LQISSVRDIENYIHSNVAKENAANSKQ